MDKGRVYLFIGAGLMLFSMPIIAFSFNNSGTDTIEGYVVWYISMLSIVDRNGSALIQAMAICAVGNLPQLIYPLINDRKAGSSPFWGWMFSFIAFFVLPGLALFFQFDNKSLIFREGYILYQVGYIFSALGFWRKHREVYPPT